MKLFQGRLPKSAYAVNVKYHSQSLKIIYGNLDNFTSDGFDPFSAVNQDGIICLVYLSVPYTDRTITRFLFQCHGIQNQPL